MIKGMHGLFYTTEPEKARAFFRDVIGFPAQDAGGGWLMFEAPAADFACHPSEESTHHEVSFSCDDIEATVKDLQAKGAQFTRPVNEQNWGWETAFQLPGGGEIQLYQPKYDSA